MAIKSYRDLIAWQKAMDLAQVVYVSIPSYIAEGQGRHSDGAFSRHLSIAHASLCELETQLLLAGRLGYIPQARLDSVMSATSEVGRLVLGLDQAVSAV